MNLYLSLGNYNPKSEHHHLSFVLLTKILTTQIAQAVRPMIEQFEIWEFVKVFAQAYDYGMGVLLFAPVAALGWIPVISACQTRFLFNEAFNRHLKIQQILSLTGKMKK